MKSDRNSHKLADAVTALVEAARKAGADAADAVAVRGASRSVSVRLGKVEATESSESDDLSLRVFVGRRVASVSANAGADPARLAERAVAMARVSPEDPHQQIAEPSQLAQGDLDLDLLDDSDIATARLTEDALATEAAALAVGGVTNSGGGSASAGSGGLVLATSAGFLGTYLATRFGRSVSVIAERDGKMERDWDYSSRLHFADLDAAEVVGRRAGERAVKRLGAKKPRTGPMSVVFDPRVARGLAGSLAAAINGASVARKTSFLRDRMGEAVANPAITLVDDPQLRRGQASRPFDGEGLRGQRLAMVENGVLHHWFLSLSAAHELGLATNGRGVRSASSVSPASTNVWIEPGAVSAASMIGAIADGVYITEVFGQGVNMVTGEYSRGASGFLIQNGELTAPVSEFTIASNLKDMFRSMIPADDLDRNYATAAPTLFIGTMTVAGA
ncbi:MAG: TldD/PmbA family protein [Phyllobacteriaceae bacterium]|nr:TldD/PmbA family protein [Phyllobacteriaceae bacterium]